MQEAMTVDGGFAGTVHVFKRSASWTQTETHSFF